MTTRSTTSRVALLALAASVAFQSRADSTPPATELPKLTVSETTESVYVAPNASTATKTETPIMDTPVSIQVIPQQALLDQQAIRIDQALRNVSGIAFTDGGDTSFGNAFDAIVLRGFATDSHLWNGVRIDSLGSDTELFTQQLANVESIEVLKGPAAILYGAVEPGGVINIVTKQPQATPAYSAQQQFGSYGLYRTTVGATGPMNEAATLLYRVDASYDTSGSIVDSGFTRDLFLAPTLKLPLGEHAQVTLEYEHKDSNFNGNYATFPVVQAANGNFVPVYENPALNYGERSDTRDRHDLGALSWSSDLGERWSIRQAVIANIVHATGPQVTSDGLGSLVPSNPNGPPGIYRFTNPYDTQDDLYATYLDITGHFATGPLQHTVLVGGDWYRFNSKYVLEVSNPTFGPDPSLDSIISLLNPVHTPAVFGSPQPLAAGTGPTVSRGYHLQDQVSVANRLFLLAGVRYQHVFESNYNGETLSSLTSSPLSGSATTPRVGLLFRPVAPVSLYANVARNWGPSNGYPLATGGLVPPTSGTQKELGIKLDVLDGRLTSTLAVYDLSKTNIPTPDPSNPFLFLVTGRVRSRGLEIDIDGEIARGWNLIANFSDIDARITASNDPGNPPGTQWPETPRLIGNLWTTYEFTPDADRGFKLGGGVNAQGRQPALNYSGVLSAQTSDYTDIAGYATLNVMAAYRIKAGGYRLMAQLNVNNLANRKYFSYVELTNPGPGSTYSYQNAIYGFDRRLYGDPRILIGELSFQF